MKTSEKKERRSRSLPWRAIATSFLLSVGIFITMAQPVGFTPGPGGYKCGVCDGSNNELFYDCVPPCPGGEVPQCYRETIPPGIVLRTGIYGAGCQALPQWMGLYVSCNDGEFTGDTTTRYGECATVQCLCNINQPAHDDFLVGASVCASQTDLGCGFP